MNYQEFKAKSAATAQVVSLELGATAVALYREGGQGVAPQIFRVVRLPSAQFLRETRRGSVSRALQAYARRKGLEAGIHPGNRFNAIPVAWIDESISCQAFSW